MRYEQTQIAPVRRHMIARLNFNPQSAIRNPQFPANAFTLLELLVAVGIIVLLIGILVPTISHVRLAAKQADTRAQIAGIAAACENYYGDFRAYPGPLANGEVAASDPVNHPFPNLVKFPGGFTTSVSAGITGFYTATPPVASQITGAENLVLGLLGGLRVDTTSTPGSPTLVYDPSLVGKGPNGLNVANPKHFAPYGDAKNLSLRVVTSSGLNTGKWGDDLVPLTGDNAGGCGDTSIPEFVDRYSDPMPLLYLRATTGAIGSGAAPTPTDNPVVTSGGSLGQYLLAHVTGYTGIYSGNSIGAGKTPPNYFAAGALITPTPTPPYHGLRTVTVTSTIVQSATYDYPLDAFPYLRNPALSGASPNTTPNVARNKDGFILISAGTDRIYGTADDITNFGDVLP